MKNKIIVLLAVVSMFAASCTPKKADSQEGVKSDSTVVKSDSTATTTPQDTVKSK